MGKREAVVSLGLERCCDKSLVTVSKSMSF
jgi:hypothetical protein